MVDKKKVLDQALDRILSGPIGQRKQWQWDLSHRTLGSEKSQEHKDKIAASHKGKVRTQKTKNKISKTKTGVKLSPFSQEHKDKIAAAHKGKKKPKLSEYHKNNPCKVNQGRDNSTYGTGALYKELTTGFIGYSYDMMEKFPGWKTYLARRKKSGKHTKYPNHHWIKLDN